MSIYITVYVILVILLLLLINFRVINHKKPSKSLTKMINEEEKEKIAHPEPALEYVEAVVQTQESLNKRKKQSATETKKDSGAGKILVALMGHPDLRCRNYNAPFDDRFFRVVST
jgi:hypothetical protein